MAAVFALELNNRPGEYSFSQKHCEYEQEEAEHQTASHSMRHRITQTIHARTVFNIS